MDADALGLLRNVAACVASDRAHADMLDHLAAVDRDEGLRYWLGKASASLSEATGHLLRAHALAVGEPYAETETTAALRAEPDVRVAPAMVPCEHKRGDGLACGAPAPRAAGERCGACLLPKCRACQDVDADCPAGPGETPEDPDEIAGDAAQPAQKRRPDPGRWRCRNCKADVRDELERCEACGWKRPAPRKSRRDEKDAEIAELAFGKGGDDGR